jgi:hypothetical protein
MFSSTLMVAALKIERSINPAGTSPAITIATFWESGKTAKRTSGAERASASKKPNDGYKRSK